MCVFAHEEHYNTTAGLYSTCWDDIFPYQSVTDIEIQSLLSNFDDQNSLEYCCWYWCCDRIEFVIKMLNPFELNDIDWTMKSTLIFIISMMLIYQLYWNAIIVAAPVDNVCLCWNWWMGGGLRTKALILRMWVLHSGDGIFLFSGNVP